MLDSGVVIRNDWLAGRLAPFRRSSTEIGTTPAAAHWQGYADEGGHGYAGKSWTAHPPLNEGSGQEHVQEARYHQPQQKEGGC